MSSADPHDESRATPVEPTGAKPHEPLAGTPVEPTGAKPHEPLAGTAGEPTGATPAQPDAMTRGYARSRARTEAIQAGLEPLGPDERPLGIKLGIALAVVIAVANLVLAAAGAGGASPALGVVFGVFMLALAAGLWARRYLVILLFQALLAISIIISTLSLAFAGNLVAVVLALGIIAACSPVFWLLIRVMARLQVPRA
jgi:hypothetical protein